MLRLTYVHIRFGLALLALSICGCRPEPVPSAPLQGHNVLLITLDTTRADRLGCYGAKSAETPALDSLAARGTLFERAYCQVPITMPSHSTLLTGRFAREHGVQRNGRSRLPGDFPTLATIFKEHGYATGAFVAAFVLDDRFGLDRGFDVYSDDMGGAPFGQQRMHMQIPGDVVTDRALAWLESVEDRRFFCWVHYFDPHIPYEAPADFAARFAHPYDAEIGFMDSQVGRLLAWLGKADLRSKTLVVAVGDHGESFGEHGEHGHGVFLYETTLHVPLIMAHPKLGLPGGTRLADVVGVVDLLPTILALWDMPAPDGLLSQSFSGLLSGGDPSPRASYAESLLGRTQYNLAEQRSLTLSRWKYISSTRPELYDLDADPEEKANVIDDYPEVAADMLTLLKAHYKRAVAGQAEGVTVSAAARKGLESLGYVASGGAPTTDEFLTPGLPDPKDQAERILRLQEAQRLSAERDYAGAAEILEKLVGEMPEAASVHHSLATCYAALGRYEDAVRHLTKTLELSPSDTVALTGLGNVLAVLGRYDEAAAHFQAALAINDDAPLTRAALGGALERLGRTSEALEHLQGAFVALHPDHAALYNEAASALVGRGFVSEAVALYRRAFQHDPEDAECLYTLGFAFLRAGQAEQGARYIEESLRADETLGRSLIQAAVARLRRGARSEAMEMLRVAEKFPELRLAARFQMGKAFADVGETEDALRHLTKALELDPAFEPAVATLTKLHLAAGQVVEAVGVLEAAVRSAPDRVRLLISLAQILATAQDNAIRDGSRALQLAEHAVALSQRRNPAALLTLASALAEVGRTEAATTTAQEALSLVEGSGGGEKMEELATRIRAQLAAFEAGRPYRAPQF